MKKYSVLLLIGVWLCTFSSQTLANEDPMRMVNGLEYIDLIVGTGAVAEADRIVTVHLIGWLNENGQKGLQFIDSHDRGKPVSFKIGTDRVMKAWSLGTTGMRVGGKRRIFVPPDLGYGEKTVGNIVPPFAELIFDIALLEVN